MTREAIQEGCARLSAAHDELERLDRLSARERRRAEIEDPILEAVASALKDLPAAIAGLGFSEKQGDTLRQLIISETRLKILGGWLNLAGVRERLE